MTKEQLTAFLTKLEPEIKFFLRNKDKNRRQARTFVADKLEMYGFTLEEHFEALRKYSSIPVENIPYYIKDMN